MRLAVPQHAAHRAQGVAFLLEVGGQLDDELLDAFGRPQCPQDPPFGGGQSQLGRRRTI